jgi:hypothetical protein
MKALYMHYLLASLVLIAIAVATLMGHRKVITIPRYLAIVVSAAVWGMYVGRLEVLLHLVR